MNKQNEKPEALPALTEAERLAVLCNELLNFKRLEKQYAEARGAVEAEIVKAVGFDRQEGAQSFRVDGFKIVCAAKITRELLPDVWRTVKNVVPEDMPLVEEFLTVPASNLGEAMDALDADQKQAVYAAIQAARPVYTSKLDVEGVRWVEANEPEIYELIAPAIKSKAAKTAVTVTRID